MPTFGCEGFAFHAKPTSLPGRHRPTNLHAGKHFPCLPSGISAIGTLYASRLVPIRDGVAGTDLMRGQAMLPLPSSQGNAEHSSGSFSNVAGGSQPVRSVPVGAGMGIDGFVDLADPFIRPTYSVLGPTYFWRSTHLRDPRIWGILVAE